MSDKPHLRFHQTLLECQISLTWFSFRPYLNCQISIACLSFRPHMNCQISLTCNFIRPYMNCQISLAWFSFRPYLNCLINLTCLSFRAPHELSDKAHLIFFQTLPESRNVQNSFAFYPPPPLRIQPKKQSAFRRRKWKKSPTLSRWNYFTNRNAVSKYFLTQYSMLPFLILRCSAPPFCFLRMSRPFTRLHCHPFAIPRFFTFLSPFPISLFTCLRNRIPLSVFMLSCCKKSLKTMCLKT